MAKAGKTTAEKRRERWAQQSKLWAQGPHEWVAFLESLGLSDVSATGPRIKLCCPYHADSNPSGTIDTVKGFYKCFSGSCSVWVRDPIQLVQRITDTSYSESFDVFRKSFKLTQKIRKDLVKEYTEEEILRKRMAHIAEAVHSYLCNCWQAVKVPESAKKAREWLQNRGITDVAALTSIGLWPRQSDLVNLLSSQGVDKDEIKEIVKFMGPYLTHQYDDAVVFIYAKAPGYVTAFKLRPPGKDKDDIRMLSQAEESDLGAFGVTHAAYSPLFANDNMDNVHVVEGEFDQLQLYAGQLSTGIVDEIFIAGGGSGHNGLDFLTEVGIKRASIIGDDDAAGNKYPEGILKKSRHVSCRIFTWPKKLRNPAGVASDPDEAVKMHGFNKFYTALLDEDNYVHSHRWCFDQAKAKLDSVNADDVVTQETVATDYGSLLKNDAERRAFADLVSDEFDLLSSITIVRAISKNNESPLEFTNNIVDWIKNYFHVISFDVDNNVLTLWDPERKVMLPIALGYIRGLTTFRSAIPGGNLYIWAREEIGLPPYFPDVENPESTQTELEKAEKLIEKQLEWAFSVIAQDAPSSTWEQKGQGIHLSQVREGKPGYLVNGKTVYKVTWKQGLPEFNEVTQLSGPSDDGNIFNLAYPAVMVPDGQQGWLPVVNESKDFFVEPKYNLKQSYAHVYDIINKICGFKHQSIDAQYCALLVFYTYLSDCIPNKKTLTHLYGLYASGKSTALSLLGNHTQQREYSLTYHACGIDDYTRPSLFQLFSGTRLMVGLDEANDPDDGSPESTKFKTIYRSFRGLMTAGHTTRTTGTADRQGNVEYFFNPVITASGTHIVDEMDSSRFNTLELVKDPNRESAAVILRDLHDPLFYEDLKHSVFINSMLYVPMVASAYDHLFTKIKYENDRRKEKGEKPIPIDRFAYKLFPLAAIAEVINQDGLAFLETFRTSREGAIKIESQTTQGHKIIDAVLNAPMEVPMDDRPYLRSLRSLLINPMEQELINSSHKGVYYDERSQCIGVAWDAAKSSLFKGPLTSYGKMGSNTLYNRVKFCTDVVIDNDEAQKLGILDRLRAYGLAGARQYSIINVGHIIEEAETSRKAVLKQQAAEAKNANAPEPDSDNPLEGAGL